MAGGNAKYYLELAREDYYLDGGEPPGKWWGGGAAGKLGLRGNVERHELEALIRGFTPDGKGKTVQNAGKGDRQPGWDLTFSAPKTVSVLWSQASPELRQAIQRAHDNAVHASLAYLEDEFAFSRLGKGGNEHVKAGLIVACFEHGTSRALDPNLHTHALVLNVGLRPDGSTGSLMSKPFYQAKMAAGALYRVQLAFELQQLDLRCERKESWFELCDVPEALTQEFSKRRAAIEAELSSRGMESASAAAFAALNTREAKKVVPPRGELFKTWQQNARDLGHILNVRFRKPDLNPRLADPRPFVKEAIEKLMDGQSHFGERDLMRHAAELAQASRVDAATLRRAVKHELEHGREIVALGLKDGEKRFTTKATLEEEAKVLSAFANSRFDNQHVLSKARVRAAIERYAQPRSAVAEELKHHARQFVRAARNKPTEKLDREQIRAQASRTLNEEQSAAVRNLLGNPGSIKVLTGLAGTGKTTTLAVCRDAWERAGYRVMGVALSAQAAHELQQGSGIKSQTLAMLRVRMDSTLSRRIRHDARQFARALRGKRTFKEQTEKLTKKTVLVLDEAGMVGTREMAWLLEKVGAAGAKLVLAGDKGQLPAIEAGAPFAAAVDGLASAELKNIVRQRDEKDREVVRNATKGNAQAVLQSLKDRGRLHVADNRDKAMEQLVEDWKDAFDKDPADTLALAGTRRDIADLNRRCQLARIMAGHVQAGKKIKVGEYNLHHGDRVLLTQNSTKLAVKNGDKGFIVAINRLTNTLTVRLDDERRVVIPISTYKNLHGPHKGESAVSLGYAMTTHKGQGTTVESTFVLLGGSMQDREMTYVQLSRAKGETHVYVDQHEAGTYLSAIAKKIATSRAKDLAHDVLMNQETELEISLGKV